MQLHMEVKADRSRIFRVYQSHTGADGKAQRYEGV